MCQAAFKGLYSFDEKKASFRTWLYRVASNKITDYYRSRRHKEFLRQIPLDDISNEIISDDTDITEQLDWKDMIKSIMNIVSGYELEWIRILQMKCFEDKTFSEIFRTHFPRYSLYPQERNRHLLFCSPKVYAFCSRL